MKNERVREREKARARSIAEPWGDLLELIPIPLEPRGNGGGRTAGKGAVGEESEEEMKEKEETRWVGEGPVDILMQFARKVQEPRRSRNLSCLMLRRAKATEDRWRHCFQPPCPTLPRPTSPVRIAQRPPHPEPMRNDRGGHLGWRVIERKR